MKFGPPCNQWMTSSSHFQADLIGGCLLALNPLFCTVSQVQSATDAAILVSHLHDTLLLSEGASIGHNSYNLGTLEGTLATIYPCWQS
jgi:hypothetical protein